MIYSTEELDSLAWAIDAEGVARHEAATAAVAAQARSVGLTSPLLDVLTDASVPAPVRERAFGKVVHALAAVSPASHPEWALAN